MKFSIFSTILLLSVGLSAAAPSGEPDKCKCKDKKSPPGPPDKSYGSITQICSASQSSVRCCTVNDGQGKGKGKGKSHHVKYKDDDYDLVCNQLYSGEYESCWLDKPSNCGFPQAIKASRCRLSVLPPLLAALVITALPSPIRRATENKRRLR